LSYHDDAASFLAAPAPDAEALTGDPYLIAETELQLGAGAVAITLSNGEEFGGSVPFWSTADSRRALLANQSHSYRVEVCADTARVYVDGWLYSDINSPLRLTPMSRAGALFEREEIARLRRGGLLIKAVDPKHHLVERGPYAATTVEVRSARVAYLASDAG